MSQQLTKASNKDYYRKLMDNVAKYAVTFGGWMVLAALLTIFFYLLYVVKPIFNSVEVNHQLDVPLSDKNNTLAIGLGEYLETAFRFTNKPSLEYYDLTQTPNSYSKQYDLSSTSTVTAFTSSAPHMGLYAYGYKDGSVQIIKPLFKVSFPNDKRVITPEYLTPFGNQSIQLTKTAIKQLAFSVYEEQAGFLYSDEKKNIYYSLVEQPTAETKTIVSTRQIPNSQLPITQLHVSPDLSRLFIVRENNLAILGFDSNGDLKKLYDLNVAEQNATITFSNLLSGANSILIANNNGVISQWFEVNGDKGPELVKARAFKTEQPDLNGMSSEFFRKTFFTHSESGTLGIYYTTSESELYQQQITNSKIQHLAVAPRANAILIQSETSLSLYKVANEHPEITWSALWQKVWYEGYPEPNYIWQSTSASDDYEAKLSLIPITFGTIKAAFYAMLFSVPIALSAAIYTAYFMPAKVRSVVKPTIEVMEALPTVILGFLAGLWLAPLIEQNIPGVVATILLMPITILLTAFSWHNLPIRYRQKLPEGMDFLLLIPIVIFTAWFSFAISPSVETYLFNGDTRLFISDELGMSFDQRNSFVVGIAMGFAVIPTIFSIAEDAIFSVPKHLSNGSLALGASQWQTLIRVVLLTASPGIFSAVMMGLGRAVGETMIVLMATGNTPIMDWSIFQGMRTLSANIAIEMPESEVGSSHYRILFLAAFVLFIFTFVFNTAAEIVRQRLREKYGSL